MWTKPEIEKKANEYAELYNSYPINVHELLSDLKIELIETRLNSDGYYINYNRNPKVFINQSIKNDQRKRFTIAHEIGHYILHGENPVLDLRKAQTTFNFEKEMRSVEEQANLFASELLAPSKILKEILPNKTITFKDVEYISNYFDISFTFAAIKAIKNSKTLNELLLYFDDNDDLNGFTDAEQILSRSEIPDTKSEVEFFAEETFDKGRTIEEYKIGSFGSLIIIAGRKIEHEER